MHSEFLAWRRALDSGKRMDCGPVGEPSSGYFMRKTPAGREAIAIWRHPDKPGNYLVWRSLTLDNPQEMDGADADDLLSTCSSYPIPYEVFVAVARENKPWPAEYETRLTVKEIQSGISWTPELGRQKLEAEWAKLEEKKWPEPALPK